MFKKAFVYIAIAGFLFVGIPAMAAEKVSIIKRTPRRNVKRVAARW